MTTGRATGGARPPDANGVLVIGYGNALRTDDGAGWHAAGLLAADPRLAGAVVMARQQLTPELAVDLAAATLAILLDATTATPPGTVTARPLGQPGAGPAGLPGPAGAGPGPTSHHVGPELLLALAGELYGSVPECFVVSVGVADMGPGETLTAGVAAALTSVADTVAGLVAKHALRGPGAGPARERP
jgi:hydrogenase maturation protease